MGLMASRLTFRDKVDVCWQKTLRDRFVVDGVPPVPHLDIGRSEVRQVSRKIAKQVIVKYEWLGTMAPSTHHYGVFFGSFCAGVVCFGFSAGANINSSKEFNLDKQELAYLARGACVHWAPKGSNSRLIASACKLLRQESEARLVIAYADTDGGEIGTIYQACNWVYIGRGSSTQQFVSPGGVIRDQKLPWDLKRKKGRTRQYWVKRLLDTGWTRQKSNPKHRYVYPLDRAMRRQIEKLRQPYPKRRPAGEVAKVTRPATSGEMQVQALPSAPC